MLAPRPSDDHAVDPQLPDEGVWLGRVERYGIGPSVVVMRDGEVFEITSRRAPTVRDVLEQPDPLKFVISVRGVRIGDVGDLGSSLAWLPPCDLQVIKATFGNFVEVILGWLAEIRAGSDPCAQREFMAHRRDPITRAFAAHRKGQRLETTVAALKDQDCWFDELREFLGLDAATLGNRPVLSAIGHAQPVPLSGDWQMASSQPEIVLAVNSRGDVLGAALGNDVSTRPQVSDRLARTYLNKDTLSGCVIGPMIRLFDGVFTLDDVSDMHLDFQVSAGGRPVFQDRYHLRGMLRSPLDQVTQVLSSERGFPDGMMLFSGTPFAPCMTQGIGRSHHEVGDRVRISAPMLGALENPVVAAHNCAPWRAGISVLMRNLAARELL